MNKFLQKYRIRIRGESITIPEYKLVAPLVYSLLFISAGFGIARTGYMVLQTEQVTRPFEARVSGGSAPTHDAAKANFNDILVRNLFNIDGTLPDASDIYSQVCPVESAKSTLAYKVTGIVFGGDAKSSVVVLEQKSNNQQKMYTLGSELIPGTNITNITANRVYVKSKYCPEYLELEYPTVASQTRKMNQKKQISEAAYSENGFERVGNDTTVTKQWVNDILNNKLSKALEDARAVPFMEGGQIKGFSLTQIVPDSVYAKLGLKNGDVVSSINGIELNDAAKAIQTLNSLRSENAIELTTIRDGQPVVLKVNIQ